MSDHENDTQGDDVVVTCAGSISLNLGLTNSVSQADENGENNG